MSEQPKIITAVLDESGRRLAGVEDALAGQSIPADIPLEDDCNYVTREPNSLAQEIAERHNARSSLLDRLFSFLRPIKEAVEGAVESFIEGVDAVAETIVSAGREVCKAEEKKEPQDKAVKAAEKGIKEYAESVRQTVSDAGRFAAASNESEKTAGGRKGAFLNGADGERAAGDIGGDIHGDSPTAKGEPGSLSAKNKEDASLLKVVKDEKGNQAPLSQDNSACPPKNSGSAPEKNTDAGGRIAVLRNDCEAPVVESGGVLETPVASDDAGSGFKVEFRPCEPFRSGLSPEAGITGGSDVPYLLPHGSHVKSAAYYVVAGEAGAAPPAGRNLNPAVSNPFLAVSPASEPLSPADIATITASTGVIYFGHATTDVRGAVGKASQLASLAEEGWAEKVLPVKNSGKGGFGGRGNGSSQGGRGGQGEDKFQS